MSTMIIKWPRDEPTEFEKWLERQATTNEQDARLLEELREYHAQNKRIIDIVIRGWFAVTTNADTPIPEKRSA